MKKVLIYVRVSTGKQVDLSIPDQISHTTKWCEDNGYHVVQVFVEPGASAMNDRRPVFQDMIAVACSPDKPCDAIVVHSLSRFFRDQVELALYERKLQKHGVTLISATQVTSDDIGGELTRRMIAMFDEFSSKENAKHTLRAMRENARQGYHNGSQPPFGYDVEELMLPSHKKPKKRLVLNDAEAEVVRTIYQLYLEQGVGLKRVAAELNGNGVYRRGNPWSSTTIHHVLTNTVYKGERIFNKRHWKTQELKSEQEWIRIAVEPIVTQEQFELVEMKLHKQKPSMTAPRLASSPRLLTSVLKCGICGARMVTATGKQNQYFYYKCSTRIKKHLDLCSSKPLPMEKTDQAVMLALADKVFSPGRVAAMLREFQQQQNGDEHDTIDALLQELEQIRFKLANVYKAIENGIELDELFKANLDKLKKAEIETSRKIAVFGQAPQKVIDTITDDKVVVFCTALRERLFDKSSKFAKEYLQLLVDEIAVDGNTLQVQGGYVPLAGAVKLTAENMKLSTPTEVLSFIANWRPLQDSNLRPTA